MGDANAARILVNIQVELTVFAFVPPAAFFSGHDARFVTYGASIAEHLLGFEDSHGGAEDFGERPAAQLDAYVRRLEHEGEQPELPKQRVRFR